MFGSQIQIILIFFVYGLAFFSMGLIMLMESGRSPLLADTRVLLPLSVFGFVHGIHEWYEMVVLKMVWVDTPPPPVLSWLRLTILAVSFISLAVFGLRVLRPFQRPSKVDWLALGGLLAVFCLGILIWGFSPGGSDPEWNMHLDVAARYSLAVPGAGLAAMALWRQSRQARSEGRRSLGNYLAWAAWSFGIYSLTQLFVPAVDFFPANLINAANFTAWTGMPIQVIRAIVAAMITVSLMRATQVVDQERQRQFIEAQNARLAALEQIRYELTQREAMRRELLRHTVIAQEDERARIARELHDETAQILTAFSLNLATLRAGLMDEGPSLRVIDHLQRLCQQMSHGLYRLVHDLRPAQLDDLGLPAALQSLMEQEQRRLNLQVNLEVRGSVRRVDPLIETVIFRVAQEALTNVARHAGVVHAEMALVFEPQQIRLRVSDQGAGFDTTAELSPPKGWGLAGMRERAEAVGGRFGLNSKIGKGTQLEVTVPVSEEVRSNFEEIVHGAHTPDPGR